MKILKSLNSFEYVDCYVVICSSSISFYTEKLFEEYQVCIVHDAQEDQFYCVDNKTHLILNTSISVASCVAWFYHIGFELIDLKRKYDKIQYNREIEHYKDFINFLQAGEYKGVIL